jgi:Tfp pilus assembly protein PilO
MKSSSSRVIVAMLVVTAIAATVWMLVLSPKREEASGLNTEVEQLQTTLVTAQSEVAEATAARQEFSEDYRKLVVIGKAVPGDEETSSLLVELNRVAEGSGVKFESISLGNEGGEVAATATAPQAGPTSPVTETIPPTEAAAALMPLGSSIGPAGLAVMPYNLTFSGSFFEIADFIDGIDEMVDTSRKGAEVKGRLITLDGFVLSPETAEGDDGQSGGAPGKIQATFSVSTYLAPPNQGVTAGATEAAPAPPAEAAPEATGTPSSFSTGGAQ